MTITIETPSDVEEEIRQDAAREGLTIEEYTLRSVLLRAAPSRAAELAPISYQDRTDELFAQWAAEDPVTGPEDLAERIREGDAITAAIQANRFNIPRDPELVAIIESMSREEDEQEPEAAA